MKERYTLLEKSGKLSDALTVVEGIICLLKLRFAESCEQTEKRETKH